MEALVLVLTPVSVAAFVLVLARLLFSRLAARAQDSLKTQEQAGQRPPGPPALPVLGNVHQLPRSYQERTFAGWAKTYGDVVHARIFGRPVLVLSSLAAVQDLLEKRSANYSDRPRLILLAELMGWDNVITHMGYGERFRRHRRWMHDNFQAKPALDGYRPIQRRETYTLLADLLAAPADFLQHVNRWTTGMIMDITYGHRIHSLDDHYVRLVHDTTCETVRAGSPGSMLVDFFPILKGIPAWMPGAGFKRAAAKIRKMVREMMDQPYDMVRAQMAAGTARPSFTAALLEETYTRGGPTAEEADDIKGAAGAVFAAGTETTTTTMTNFLLAMTLHPEAFQKAQAELDRVVGRARLPDFDDRGSLPYLDCVISEVLRWRCPVPLGVPHSSTHDDEYRGHHVPAGTMVIPNIWHMTQDPTLFPQPHAFRPERWLEMDAATAARAHPRRLVFGFGRRVCPGRDFAEGSVWLAAACVLALFDVAPARDAAGRAVPPRAEHTSGFVSQPKPFECSIRPRGDTPAEAAAVIEKARTALTA